MNIGDGGWATAIGGGGVASVDGGGVGGVHHWYTKKRVIDAFKVFVIRKYKSRFKFCSNYKYAICFYKKYFL